MRFLLLRKWYQDQHYWFGSLFSRAHIMRQCQLPKFPLFSKKLGLNVCHFGLSWLWTVIHLTLSKFIRYTSGWLINLYKIIFWYSRLWNDKVFSIVIYYPNWHISRYLFFKLLYHLEFQVAGTIKPLKYFSQTRYFLPFINKKFYRFLRIDTITQALI